MTPVRMHGDPFAADAAASRLRSFLRVCLDSGVRCALSLAGVELREVQPGQRVVPLTDGVRELLVGTSLCPAELELVLRAVNTNVPSTAPVLVFAAPARRDDAVREAGLAWRRAAVVLAAHDGPDAADLLQRVRAELRWAGTESPPHALDERELAPWLALPDAARGGPVVCVLDDADDGGADLAIAAWRHVAAVGGAPRLRFVVPGAASALPHALRALLGEHAHDAEIVAAPFEPEHVRDASALLLPWRRVGSTRAIVLALASGRPVAAARFAATAALLDAAGTCLPIGGTVVADEPRCRAHFAPAPAAVAAALQAALAPDTAGAIGRRARTFVVEELSRDRPSPPPPRVVAAGARRPVVVLEAPLFETSSSAELTIATARALERRGRVDVRLVPASPPRRGFAALRARAPELAERVCRDPGDVDLWLSAGWPVRSARPPCRTWALRVDQEHGALACELTPHVTQEADVVIVHSEHVQRTLSAAGRTRGVALVPHGVDEVMHEHATPDAAITAWKQHQPAVLFCGGTIWRKGFDVFLHAALAAHSRGAHFALVVKTVGNDQHYARHHLGDLLARVRATPGTPPVFVVDRDLTRHELAGVYTACDLLLHPYRGEGFCLPVLEARACGLPVLATAGGATEALMSGPGAVRIPSRRRSLELPTPHVTPPWVLEPSPEAAADLLATTLADLAAAQRAARAAAPAVRAAHTWDAAACAIEELAFAPRTARLEPLFTLLPASAPARDLEPAAQP